MPIIQTIKNLFAAPLKHSVHNISMKTLEGKTFSFKQFGGKKVLIVNVASACGLTPQYEKLQKLYEATKNKLVIVGVPCNDFAAQEPGSPTEIRNFCTVNYGVTFPITEKVNIKTEPIHPLYQLLTMKEKNHLVDSEVEWNFQKYLLNEQGILTNVFKPDVQPDDEAITQAVLR